MKSVVKYLKIYAHFWKVAFSLATMYRADSIMLLIGVVLALSLNMVFFDLVFQNTPIIGGWNFNEVIFLLGVFQTSWGIGKVLYHRQMEEVVDLIFYGTYDFFLLKPIEPRFLAYLLPPLTKGISSAATGAVFMAIAWSRLGVSPNLAQIIVFLLYLLVGHLVLFSFCQIAIALSFSNDRSDEVFAVFENAWMYSRYPKEIFKGKVYAFLTYIVPITIFTAFPASILLGKTEISFSALAIPIVVALVFLTISNRAYKMGLRRYTGASS